MALFGPAWQASVSEQVPADALPAAVALNGISYNIARSFGPAIGGIDRGGRGQRVAPSRTNAVVLSAAAGALLFWRRVQRARRGCRPNGWRGP